MIQIKKFLGNNMKELSVTLMITSPLKTPNSSSIPVKTVPMNVLTSAWMINHSMGISIMFLTRYLYQKKVLAELLTNFQTLIQGVRMEFLLFCSRSVRIHYSSHSNFYGNHLSGLGLFLLGSRLPMYYQS